MKCHGSYLIADFENFSPDTLKWLIFAVTAYGTESVNKGLVVCIKIDPSPNNNVGYCIVDACVNNVGVALFLECK